MQVNRKLSLNKGWWLHCFSFSSLKWHDKTSVPKCIPLLHRSAGWQDALWQSKFLPYIVLCSFPLNSCLKEKKSYSASKISLFVLDGCRSLRRQYNLPKLLFNLIFIFTNILLTASYSHALYDKWFFMLREEAGNERILSWYSNFFCIVILQKKQGLCKRTHRCSAPSFPASSTSPITTTSPNLKPAAAGPSGERQVTGGSSYRRERLAGSRKRVQAEEK